MTENDTVCVSAAAEKLMRQAATARRDARSDDARRLFEDARLLYQACGYPLPKVSRKGERLITSKPSGCGTSPPAAVRSIIVLLSPHTASEN